MLKIFNAKICIIASLTTCLLLVAAEDIKAQLSYTLNAPAGSTNTQWKKVNLSTGAITNLGGGASFAANTVGAYYAEFDYKACRKKSDYAVLIDGCVPAENTLVRLNASTVVGGTYQWFKDGMPLAGATNALLNLTSKDTGVFYAMINSGGCMIKSEIFNVQVLRISCNFPPIASPYIVNTLVGQTTSINLSSGTNDPNGDPLSFIFLGPSPTNATVKIDANGNAILTPNPGFVGTISFSYIVCDVTTQIPNPLCDTETVTVRVLNKGTLFPPIANNDRVTLPKNRTANIQILANDAKGSGDSLLPALYTFGTAGRGTASMLSNGTVNYTPVFNFIGIDSVYYRVCDAVTPSSCDSAIIFIQYTDDSIAFLNLPPLATDDFYNTTIGKSINLDVVLNDSDPDGDSLNIPAVIINVNNGVLINRGNGKYTYRPDSSFVGKDTFVYRICDYGAPVLCDTALVVIDIPCPNINGFGIDSLNPLTCNGSNGIITLKGLIPNVLYNVNYKKDGVPQSSNNIKSDGIGELKILNLGRGSYTNFTVNIVSSATCIGSSAVSVQLVGPSPGVSGLNILCK